MHFGPWTIINLNFISIVRHSSVDIFGPFCYEGSFYLFRNKTRTEQIPQKLQFTSVLFTMAFHQPVAFVTPRSTSGDKKIDIQIETPNGGLFDTLEKIVLTAEARSDLPPSAALGSASNKSICTVPTFGGPLTTKELSRLSLISTSAVSSLCAGNEAKNKSFGSVDGDLLMNLIPLLEQHVEAAASVDLIREASKVVAANKIIHNGTSGYTKSMTIDKVSVMRKVCNAWRRCLNSDTDSSCNAVAEGSF